MVPNGRGPGDAEMPKQVPVLVVGGGPAGVLCAYLLARFGSTSTSNPNSYHAGLQAASDDLPPVKCVVIEKYPHRLAAPKAHAICPRSFEICRQSGLDTAAMRKLGSPREDAYWVNFVTNLSGERIGVLPYERMDVDVLDDTPEARLGVC
jgi:2-polyprenyl-6-methoxyphenol hydroxylase-like FAD-dependent oxidoreductase